MILLATAFVVQLGAEQAVDRAVVSGIERGIYPGAVVVIGTRDTLLLSKGYGSLTWSGSERPDPDSTLYDLASLTKVVATTGALMTLVDRAALDLDEAVQRHLPEFAGDGKDAVTVRHLLQHRSGLRAFLPLHERARDAAQAKRLVLAEPLSWPPGGRVVYSDLNAMLAGWVVEAVTGGSLDSVARREVFLPLQMHETRFAPAPSLRRRIAPVGHWRRTPIAGEVHDQNAARLDGVSGHAGLYSTGADLARYAQTLLAGGRAPDGTRWVSAATVAEFTRRGPGNRSLGWEMRDTTTAENTGRRLSSRAFGHGGYTGTSMWIDPANDLFVIVLTNRVYAPRTNRSITLLKAVRAAIADAAVALRVERCGAAVLSGAARPC